jgi:curli biogenesis system outer membrane secretion channel CsgG
MRKLLAFVALVAASLASAAFADPNHPYGMDRGSGNQTAPDLPHCDRPIGVAAVKEPDQDWWSPLGLSNPEAVLKMFALRSGCLRMVDRNQGLAMRSQEQGLASSGELQRGSNLGRGQVLAADYFIIPDISHANQNSGGGNMGAAFGRFVPGGFGAVVGSISIQSKEASTEITLVDARTTEQLYVAEGAAKKTDVGFGGSSGFGGWAGFGALAGSGYTNTDIGQVIMAAYYKAFVDLVHYMQAQQPGQQQANAPIAAETVAQDSPVRSGPSNGASLVFTVHTGALVYPTGERSGIWMEVDDEHGNRGWMLSTSATAR